MPRPNRCILVLWNRALNQRTKTDRLPRTSGERGGMRKYIITGLFGVSRHCLSSVRFPMRRHEACPW